MIVIPAVDIKNGKCVRLLHGNMDAETVFSDDPLAMALRWQNEGGKRLHIVDLDGAIEKRPKNLDLIKSMVEKLDIPVQVGGGIRDLETIDMYFSIGVKWVIIGTAAIKNPDMVKSACKKYPGQIIVGIDAREGKVAVEGWVETTEVTAVDLARQYEGWGVSAINFTDIHRDGAHSGPNIEQTKGLAEAVSIPVVASGGVSTIKDIENLKKIESSGIVGVITGRALYDGTLDLREAIKIAERASL
ncbi:1-(5-phosphoribosyl)-5-[(5-phosphoribosylamino)methylideneamino]imidazole-4-carboxamide isomerase [Desulforegula conservatrix]|uniref:1-(5-phosphoribosyl)-5-[(5- phosphoribosylamino)methylideneamino]imidazole-4- carboxamide isomerase n=1 Tax=Desulforegula conservatrix TaxID=153026 RepID=UPI000410F180|nr:1-(5-phosphoribosyl)-5-[(5-phosphoribosylamino)methylideneamino]imidazole-4-carboxamide isomerase [Desulforegula conservatrix]